MLLKNLNLLNQNASLVSEKRLVFQGGPEVPGIDSEPEGPQVPGIGNETDQVPGLEDVPVNQEAAKNALDRAKAKAKADAEVKIDELKQQVDTQGADGKGGKLEIPDLGTDAEEAVGETGDDTLQIPDLKDDAPSEPQPQDTADNLPEPETPPEEQVCDPAPKKLDKLFPPTGAEVMGVELEEVTVQEGDTLLNILSDNNFDSTVAYEMLHRMTKEPNRFTPNFFRPGDKISYDDGIFKVETNKGNKYALKLDAQANTDTLGDYTLVTDMSAVKEKERGAGFGEKVTKGETLGQVMSRLGFEETHYGYRRAFWYDEMGNDPDKKEERYTGTAKQNAAIRDYLVDNQGTYVCAGIPVLKESKNYYSLEKVKKLRDARRKRLAKERGTA